MPLVNQHMNQLVPVVDLPTANLACSCCTWSSIVVVSDDECINVNCEIGSYVRESNSFLASAGLAMMNKPCYRVKDPHLHQAHIVNIINNTITSNKKDINYIWLTLSMRSASDIWLCNLIKLSCTFASPPRRFLHNITDLRPSMATWALKKSLASLNLSHGACTQTGSYYQFLVFVYNSV